MKITKRTVDAATAYPDKDVWLYDDDLKGFALRVWRTGVKSYVVQYRVGEGRTGVKRTLTLGKHGTLAPDQARAMAKQVLADVSKGKDPQGSKVEEANAMTLAELIAIYLADIAAMKKPATVRQYTDKLNKVSASKLGKVKAAAITTTELAKFHRSLSDTPYSANRTMAALSAMFGWASKRHYTGERNPARGIERFREEGRERYLTAEELSRLGDALALAESEGLPWQLREGAKAKHRARDENQRTILDPFAVAAIRLLLLTGCRLREILDLAWTDIDFEQGLLRLRDSKTGKKTVVLNAPALAVLDGLPRYGRFVISGANAGSKSEKPRSDLNKPWRAVKAAAGIDELRIHDLRHSHASVAAGLGLSLPMIGKLLGHSQPQTTARYAHLANDPLRAASEKIGADLAQKLGMNRGKSADVVALRGRT